MDFDLSSLKDLNKPDLLEVATELFKRNKRFLGQIRSLHKRLKIANEEIVDLRKKVEQLTRASKRQAAPFGVKAEKRKTNRKRPGRKPGHKGSYRKYTGKIDQDEEVTLDQCPNCENVYFDKVNRVEQIVEEIVATKIATKVITYEGICTCCGKKVSSEHPLKISNARGAAGTYLGPQAKLLALYLNFQLGLSKRKTVALLKKVFIIDLSPSGLVQLSHKAAKLFKDRYNQLKKDIRKSPVIHADETSWYVGEPKYWLWVFTNKGHTLYHVIKSRARDVIYDILGQNYPGVLVSDCLSIYDDVNELQQKCYAHHLKALSTAKQLAEKSEKDLVRLQKIQKLLKKAIQTKYDNKLGKVTDSQYRGAIKHMKQQADNLIPSMKKLENSQALKKLDFMDSTIGLLKRLSKQKDHLFTFMEHPHVDATNNQAERQLRPAVIARKVSCGNRSQHGAKTWQILTSLMQTFIQQGKSFDDSLIEAFHQSIEVR